MLAFLPQLRPGWWVLRGYVAVLVVDTLAGYQYYSDIDDLLLPHVQGSQVWAAFAIVAAIWGSIALGRRSHEGALRRLSWVVNAAVLGFGVLSASMLNPPFMPPYYDSASESAPYLQHADGAAIANICPYSTDGKLLAGVLLFDQDGRAIENIAAEAVYPPVELPFATPPPAVIRNAYPRPLVMIDPRTMQAHQFRCPEFLPPSAQAPGAGTPGGAQEGPVPQTTVPSPISS